MSYRIHPEVVEAVMILLDAIEAASCSLANKELENVIYEADALNLLMRKHVYHQAPFAFQKREE